MAFETQNKTVIITDSVVDGISVPASTGSYGRMRRHPWERAVRCVCGAGDGAAAEREGRGRVADSRYNRAVKPTGCERVQKIHRQGHEPLLQQRHAEVRCGTESWNVWLG